MKKEYNIKDQVWVHLGEAKLIEGRVVDIIDLEHLKEGHSPDRELYIIEIKTGIDDVYEVRGFDEISPDSKGPINLFRKHTDAVKNNRYLKKVGMPIPIPGHDFIDAIEEIENDLDNHDDPTPDQIHAALDKAEKGHTTIYKPAASPAKKPTKRKPFARRKKNAQNNTTM